MLRIERCAEAGAICVALSGRIEGEHLAELARAIADERAAPTEIVLDLEEVRLVDREAVGFLARCEAAGIRLARCPAYVREWIDCEGDGPAPAGPASRGRPSGRPAR